MADSKVSALTLQTTTDGDEFVYVAEPQGTSPETYTSKKTTTAALGHQFRGARAYLTSDKTSQNYTSTTTLTWDTASPNSPTIWAGGNPSRLTVPSEWDGAYVEVLAAVGFRDVTDGKPGRAFVIHRDSGGTAVTPVDAAHQVSYSMGTNLGLNILFSPCQVSAGDYFEIGFQMGTDTSITFKADRSFFSIRLIGIDPA